MLQIEIDQPRCNGCGACARLLSGLGFEMRGHNGDRRPCRSVSKTVGDATLVSANAQLAPCALCNRRRNLFRLSPRPMHD